MNEHNEEHRLLSYLSGQIPEHLSMIITFKCDKLNDCISKIQDVMKLIIRSAETQWPPDDYWQNNLPDWLLKTFKTYSPEELSKILANRSAWDKLDWTFGSWLDRMKEREWKWWSLATRSNQVRIYLMLDSYPTSIKPLEHLIRASGGYEIISE